MRETIITLSDITLDLLHNDLVRRKPPMNVKQLSKSFELAIVELIDARAEIITLKEKMNQANDLLSC